MIHGVLVLERLRVLRCTVSLHGTVTVHDSLVIHSYSLQLTPPCIVTLYTYQTHSLYIEHFT